MTSPPHAEPTVRAADPSDARIRSMVAADIDDLLALEHSTPEAPHWPRRDYEAILGTPADGAAITRAALVAELDGHLAGFAVVRELRLPAAPNHSETVHCELESIVVAGPLRGRGIGLHLMNATLELAAATGADRLELEVRASNHPGIGLYTRAGFTLQGRRPAYYSDPPDDALLMSQGLNSARPA